MYKEIDYEEVEELAAKRCTQHDIAIYLGWNPDGFSTRKKHDKKLREALRRGYSRFNIDLTKAQYEKAIRCQDTKMLIHLGTHYLGQKEKLEISGDAKNPVTITLVDIVKHATEAKESGKLSKPLTEDEEDSDFDDYETYEENNEGGETEKST